MQLDTSKEELEILRLGFVPALVFGIAGISRHQHTAKKVNNLSNSTETPPIILIKEPDNNFDKFAIKIVVGTAQDELTSEWSFEDIGYIPRRACTICGNLMGGIKNKEINCNKCGKIMTDIDLVNKNIYPYLNKEGFKVGLDGIYKSQTNKQGNLGARIAIRYDSLKKPKNEFEELLKR